MADLQAGKRYAQAAFGIALESGTIGAWRAALDEVAAVLAESDAAGVFADGRLPLEQRLAMVERSLDVPPLALNLAKLLVSKGRSADARAVADAFGRMADEREGIVHASITAAVDLSPQQVAGIEQRLSSSLGKTVHVASAADPGIVGGLVIRVGDRMVDGSVRTRLKRLRRELEGAR